MPFTYTVDINENGSGTYITRQNGDGTVHYSTDGGHTWTDVALTVQPWMTRSSTLDESITEALDMYRQLWSDYQSSIPVIGIAEMLEPKKNLSPFQQWEEELNNG